jgi:hypothetical protein
MMARLVSLAVCVGAACAAWAVGGDARAQYGLDLGTIVKAKAKPGKCKHVPALCAMYGAASIPSFKADCTPQTHPNGMPICSRPTVFWCGVGFQPLYKGSLEGTYYYSQTDAGIFHERMRRWKENTGFSNGAYKGDAILDFDALIPWDGGADYRPDLDPKTRWANAWYCSQLRLVESLAESDDDLIDRLRSGASGVIARFNSVFGGVSDLKSLQKRFREHRRQLQREYASYLIDEALKRKIVWGYYSNRISHLNDVRRALSGLSDQTTAAGRAIVRTADRATVIAKKVQRVLIKVAGYAVFVFTGGNRIAQCLTEAGIETAANTFTKKLQGNELTLGGVGSDALRTLIFRCADALTSGPAGEIINVILGPFKGLLDRLSDVIKQKVRSAVRSVWDSIKGKVQWAVDKLGFLMGDDLKKALTHTSQEVFVEFAAAAVPACAVPLVERDFKELFMCLGRAGRHGLVVGVPRGLFDTAMDFLENNLPKARSALEDLARKLSLSDDPTVRSLLTGLGAVSRSAVKKARACREEITSFASAPAAFRCLARSLGAAVKDVKALGKNAVLTLLEEALGAAEHRLIEALRSRRDALSSGLDALGLELPNAVRGVLDSVASDLTKSFAKKARGCARTLRGRGGLKEKAAAALRCLGDAAKAAGGSAGHALVRAAVELLAKEGEKGIKALAAAVQKAVRSVAAVSGNVRLVPAQVEDAIQRAVRAGQNTAAKKFAKELRGKCSRRPVDGTNVLAYVRTSATCIADAATTALKAAGAAALNVLLFDLVRYVRGLAKLGKTALKSASGKLKERIRAVATMLGLELPPGGPNDVAIHAGLVKNAAAVATKAGACVLNLYRASLGASKKHERISSMAKLLRVPLRDMGPCLKRAVGAK